MKARLELSPDAERDLLEIGYLIEADSLDEAVAYAKMLSGTVEVRPCIDH